MKRRGGDGEEMERAADRRNQYPMAVEQEHAAYDADDETAEYSRDRIGHGDEKAHEPHIRMQSDGTEVPVVARHPRDTSVSRRLAAPGIASSCPDGPMHCSHVMPRRDGPTSVSSPARRGTAAIVRAVPPTIKIAAA